MTQKDDDLIIRKAPLFSALDDEAAHELRQSMVALKLNKGQVLFLSLIHISEPTRPY